MAKRTVKDEDLKDPEGKSEDPNTDPETDSEADTKEDAKADSKETKAKADDKAEEKPVPDAVPATSEEATKPVPQITREVLIRAFVDETVTYGGTKYQLKKGRSLRVPKEVAKFLTKSPDRAELL